MEDDIESRWLDQAEAAAAEPDEPDYDSEHDACPTCGGEGFIEYIDAPEAWGEDCPSLKNHLVECTNCGGSGEIKDCKFG